MEMRLEGGPIRGRSSDELDALNNMLLSFNLVQKNSDTWELQGKMKYIFSQGCFKIC